MTEILIPDGLYGGKLLNYLWQKRFDESFDQLTLQIIQKLCKSEVVDGQAQKDEMLFNGKEKEILNSIDIVSVCRNKDVVARWCDYVQVFNKIKRRQYLKVSVDNYNEVFYVINDYAYLVRSLQLVRKATALFRDKLDEIYGAVKEVIYKMGSSYWQQQLLTELTAIFKSEKCKQDFSSVLEENLKVLQSERQYSDAAYCIQSLNVIGTITDNERRIQLSENYEKEGDWQVAQKVPNTYHPNLYKSYLNALKQVHSVPDCENLKRRVEKKLAIEQAENFRMVSTVGVPMMPPIDFEEVHRMVFSLGIDSFNSGYKELIMLPIVPRATVAEFIENSKSSRSTLEGFFADTVRIDERGAKVGVASIDNMHVNNLRSFFRQRHIAILKAIKNLMDIYKKVDKAFVFGLIENSKSRFIPENRLYIYAEAISQGFENNFLSSVHLLIPQIENSFRYVAQQNGIETTKWPDELQHQKVFGGIVEKIQGFTEVDLYEELKNFLVDSSSNFRNELCHGLMEPTLIEHHGIYLWWLTLKMIMQTDSHFRFEI